MLIASSLVSLLPSNYHNKHNDATNHKTHRFKIMQDIGNEYFDTVWQGLLAAEGNRTEYIARKTKRQVWRWDVSMAVYLRGSFYADDYHPAATTEYHPSRTPRLL